MMCPCTRAQAKCMPLPSFAANTSTAMICPGSEASVYLPCSKARRRRRCSPATATMHACTAKCVQACASRESWTVKCPCPRAAPRPLQANTSASCHSAGSQCVWCNAACITSDLQALSQAEVRPAAGGGGSTSLRACSDRARTPPQLLRPQPTQPVFLEHKPPPHLLQTHLTNETPRWQSSR